MPVHTLYCLFGLNLRIVSDLFVVRFLSLGKQEIDFIVMSTDVIEKMTARAFERACPFWFLTLSDSQLHGSLRGMA